MIFAGTGKTYMSAFAMRELGFKSALFVVHRNQIAKQAMKSYRKVFAGSVSTGRLTGKHQDYDADIIFENRVDGKSQLFSSVNHALKKICSEGTICGVGTGTVFRIATMDKVLPTLNEDISSWNDKYLYKYWIRIDKGRIYGVFELGGWNIPDQNELAVTKIIEKLKPNDKKKEFKYKRVNTTKWYSIKEDADDYDKEVEKQVRKVVDDLLKKEMELVDMFH